MIMDQILWKHERKYTILYCTLILFDIFLQKQKAGLASSLVNAYGLTYLGTVLDTW